MQQCGFCAVVSGLLRRAMCIENRRSSTDSYYRDTGEQDSLRMDVRFLEGDNSGDMASFNIELELCGLSSSPMPVGKFLSLHKRRKGSLITRSLSIETALLDDLQLGQVQCVLDHSSLWRFNAFSLDTVSGGRCLPVLCVHLFQMYGLMNHFKLDEAKVWKLFILIEEGYHSSNPYHNSIHAADVTQAMHCFLQQKKIRENMKPLEILATLIAAMAHDIDHPGVNQQFLIATSNHLATLYRNTSVLENHHWRSTISCVIESGLFDQLRGIWDKLQNQISSLILATDISRQQEYLGKFKGHLDTKTLNLARSDHRHLVLQIALKCADISNPCRPWDISRKWSLNICEEFFRQGDYERRLNQPVTPLYDRNATSIPKIQTGFFKSIVVPLVSEWHRFLNNDLSAVMLKNLMINQEKWDMLLAEELTQATEGDLSIIEANINDAGSCSGTNIDGSPLVPDAAVTVMKLKQIGINELRRRFSVPLNLFQDHKLKQHEEVSEDNAVGGDAVDSLQSLYSQLSVGGLIDIGKEEIRLSTERLLQDCSIASITTPHQATRLNTVLKGGTTWKLVRQQTFPPLETVKHLASKPFYMSNEETIYSGLPKTEIGSKVLDMSKMSPDKAESNVDSENLCDDNGAPVASQKENLDPLIPRGNGTRRESAPDSRQLHENVSAAAASQAVLDPDLLMHRRKSMPAETSAQALTEKKSLEIPLGLPDLMSRTLSYKEAWSRRRGSAPAPVALSEIRQLPALGMRHSSNGGGGGRRNVSPTTCQQWLAQATSMQDNTLLFPRRSSLPVEVHNRTESDSSNEFVTNENATDTEDYKTPCGSP